MVSLRTCGSERDAGAWRGGGVKSAEIGRWGHRKNCLVEGHIIEIRNPELLEQLENSSRQLPLPRSAISHTEQCEAKPYTRLSVTMKTEVLLAVLVLGKTAQAFVSSPFTARAVSRVCGADHRCEWTAAPRRRSGGVCMATSSELDQSAE